jgi:hypothetical protein
MGSEEKARLLNMAQAWTYLAARIERIGKFAKGDRPDGLESVGEPSSNGSGASTADGTRSG